MPQWTPGQSNAINARNKNILVSAAAGSGKTAVLVERVIKLITDKTNPVDIDRLLIVTFTNAAAAEMRYRISKSLNGLIKSNPNDSFYKRQLSLLPNAKISTIDAFCASLVKEHFYELSINQDFSTFDESELQLLEDNVISETLDKCFEENNADFISLFEMFTSPGNEKPVINAVKRLLRFIYAQPFPYKWLEKSAELYNPDISLAESVWFEYVKNEIDYLSAYALELAKENMSLIDFEDEKINLKFSDVINDDIKEIERIQALSYSWTDLINERKPSFKRMPSSSKVDKAVSEKIKANREVYKSILTKDIESFLISDEDDYRNDAKVLYKRIQSLTELLKAVDERLMQEKKELNSYSFSDIEHFAISLLFKLDDDGNIIRTALAHELSENYYEILVDEYQDTNEAQDLLFTYLSNGKNLFTVGDIKQSIYRFRLAMPHIFNAKKKNYDYYNAEDSSVNAKIILDKNFRSRSEICSYVNFVFSNLMTEKLGELDYNTDEFLNYGADYKESIVPSAQLKILTGVKGEEYDRLEAAYIAKTIIKKVNSGELVKDGCNYRPINYGDFAILMRKVKGHIDTYSQVLSDFGIPVICDNSTNLFENNEIRILLSLIRVIDNPMLDIPLLTVMLSPIYGFTEDEMAQFRIDNRFGTLYSCIYSSDNSKAKNFISNLKELKKISVSMSVAGFIRYLIDDKGLIGYFNAMGNGELRYQNVLKLIAFAEKFDSGVNVGLTAFIRYIDKIASSDKGIDSAALSAAAGNSVTIMSVHHSKGLEFPVCIFAGTTKQYNKQDLNDKLLLNTSLGVGLKCHNEEEMYQYNSLQYTVIKNKNDAELMSENLRVLYVAMTRAKEQFISFVTVDNLESKIKKLASNIGSNAISPYSCKKINSDGDFLLMCALMHGDCKTLRELSPFNIKTIHSDFRFDVEITDEISAEESDFTLSFTEPDHNIVRQIEEKLSFKYNRCNLSALSSKLTASSLDDMERGFEYLTSSKPSFLNKGGLTPAQRGTAMHTFMQFCSYENSLADLEKEIARIKNLGHINNEQAESLDRNMLIRFFNSDLASQIFDADKVYREIKVTSFVPVKEIYGMDAEESVLIQGIADCVIEKNNELVLIDYKTDNVSNEEELLGRYKKQITFYKSAIGKTLNKPVKTALLYSFKLGKCCYYK